MSFSDFVTAAEKGAASIYHQVLSTGTLVTDWETAHPEIAPLIESATAYANSLLTRFGVPVGTIEILGEDIIVALKGWAAGDATVQSVPVSTTTTVTQSIGAAVAVVAAMDPALAPIAAAVDPALPVIAEAETIAKDVAAAV